MRTQWFADPADGERLDETLLRPVGAASRMLDGLVRPPVAPGTGRIDAAASAVVLPHAAVPGCSLVVQVAGWSSSVGCWWSVSTDPLAGPANLELATELPLQPNGLTRAVAWLERELQRPVAARDRRYGLARRRRWAVVLDDGYELPIRHRWLPGGGAAESGGGGMVPGVAARGGRVPGEAAALGGTALAGVLPGPGAWLLGLAVAAALGRWVLTALTPQLIGAPWTGPAVRALDLTAAAALLAWFWGAAAQRPSRVRVPMLAGLLLATLGAGLALVLGQPEWAPPVESARGALGLFLRDQSPSLFSAAALACYLRAFLGAPGRAAPRPPWPRALPVAAGVAWGVDLAVGLGWLARFEPAGPGETTLVWYGVLVVAMRATACRAGPGAGARPPRPPARPVPAGRPGRPGRRRPAGAGLVDDHPGRHQLAGPAPPPGPGARASRRSAGPRRLRRHRLARRRRRRPSDALEGRRWSQAEGGHGRQQEPDGQAAEPG
jgi:hypothetical protein